MMSGESQENMEEERRLFYVAITRAEKRLFLSHANNRFKWGQYIDCEPSRFLEEVDQKFIMKKDFSSVKKQEIAPHKIYAKIKPQIKKTLVPKQFVKTNFAKNITINQSDLSKLQTGQNVKHAKFGNGKILQIEGEGSNKKATVFFSGIGQKQLLLKFAKLEIIK